MYNLRIKKFNDFTVYYKYNKPIISKKVDNRTYLKNKKFLKEVGDIVEIEKDEEKTKINKLRSNRRTKNAIYEYACCNDFSNGYFLTLTFSPEYVDRLNYQECYKKIKSYIDNLRKKNKDMKYLFVCETHKKGGYHFHGLVANAELKLKKFKNDVYNVDNFSWGYSTATIIKDPKAVSIYITKYITKDLDLPKGARKYLRSDNLKKAQIIDEYVYNIDELEIESTNIKKYGNEYLTIERIIKSNDKE